MSETGPGGPVETATAATATPVPADSPHERRRRIIEWFDEGRLNRAEAEIRSLLDLQWKAPENVYLFGVLALLRGRFHLARAAIDHSFALKPWLTEVPSWCGSLRERLAEAELAEPDWLYPRYRRRLDTFETYGLTLTSALSTYFEHDDVQLVQVGANDGVHTDPLHRWIVRFGWRALLVEPMPEPFAALRAEHGARSNVALANVAVSDRDGTRTMWSHPSGRHGVSTFLPERNILRHERDLVAVEVECRTFARLLAEHSIDRVDVLQIDTEGYDFEILKLVDLDSCRPAVIHLEFYLLPLDERLELMDLLDRHGYAWRRVGADLLAVDTERFTVPFGLIRDDAGP